MEEKLLNEVSLLNSWFRVNVPSIFHRNCTLIQKQNFRGAWHPLCSPKAKRTYMSVLGQTKSSRQKPPNFLSRISAGFNSFMENETSFGYFLLIPTLIVVIGLVGYPFLISVYYSFTNKSIGMSAADIQFIGFKNFQSLIGDHIYRKALINTFNFTITAVLF